MAEDKDDNNNGKALLRSLLRTMRLGRDPRPPRQLAGFIIKLKMKSMEGVWLQAGHVCRDDLPPSSSSCPPSEVVTSWVNHDNNYETTMTACAPPPLPSLLPPLCLKGSWPHCGDCR
jgi:hypothetical protein